MLLLNTKFWQWSSRICWIVLNNSNRIFAVALRNILPFIYNAHFYWLSSYACFFSVYLIGKPCLLLFIH